MYQRLLFLCVAWPLLLSPAFAGEIGANSEIRLNGTLVSPTGRSALINGRVARVGDRVAGAEIFSIDEGEVQLTAGSERLVVRVGSSKVHVVPSNSVAPSQDYVKDIYGPVRRGETLSQIAERHVKEELTLNQVMIALFEANPDAFHNNINNLREGASLHMPDFADIQRLAAATAAAEVQRQMNIWLKRRPETPIQHANDVKSISYGPVAPGETLSGIAASLPRDGVTMNQTITALYDANPGAFGGNRHLLLEGAVLHIPTTLRGPKHPIRSAGTTDPDPPAVATIVSMNFDE